jgi:hypothetical protein
MTRLLLSLVVAGVVARADFDPTRWQFRRRIAISKPAAVASFTVDLLLYEHSRFELADLRIVRDQVETPYIIRKLDTLDEFPVAPAISQETNTRTTVLVVDIGFQGLPHDGVQLVIDSGQFYRSFTVESSRDSTKWRPIGAGVIFRRAEREALTNSFAEQWDRYLRVRIANRDDPPLAVRQLILSTERRVVEFPADASGPYWLYYGSSGARRPSYDFAETRPIHAQTVMVELGTEEINPAYREPLKPWTDRRPAVLYAVFAAASLIMGFVAVRFLIKMRS